MALGWINNRMTLGGFEPFVDIVSDLYTGVPLSHLIDTLTPGNPIKVFFLKIWNQKRDQEKRKKKRN